MGAIKRTHARTHTPTHTRAHAHTRTLDEVVLKGGSSEDNAAHGLDLVARLREAC